MFLEEACLDVKLVIIGETFILQVLDEGLVYISSDLWWCCIHETGSISFARISCERELADCQNFAVDVYDGAIHFVIFVGEDAQVCAFFRHP